MASPSRSTPDPGPRQVTLSRLPGLSHPHQRLVQAAHNSQKGLASSHRPRARMASRELTRALYPDIVYGRDSGGRPDKIPDLTYEKYCAFHKRFYHPSNARIFVDGKVQIKEILAKLDSYLSGFDRMDVKADIPSQKPVDVKLRIPYESAKCENKTTVVELYVDPAGFSGQ